MAAIRVQLTIEVERKGNALAIRTPVPVELVYENKRWHLECETPAVTTEECSTIEEAIIAGARQVGDELQAAVVERPVIVGKITPESVERMF